MVRSEAQLGVAPLRNCCGLLGTLASPPDTATRAGRWQLVAPRSGEVFIPFVQLVSGWSVQGRGPVSVSGSDAVLEKHLPRARCRYLYLYLRNTAASFSDRSQPGVTLPLQLYLVIISLQRHDR